MFKKLLTVGTLATALIGGIGTASAFTYNYCTSTYGSTSGPNYSRYVVNPYNNFANVFDSQLNGKMIRWYFQSSQKLDEKRCGAGKYVAYYKGKQV
ncbi:hypothetical protein Ppb6_02830 [Photorhabdus australis subsp. thailandensis]|uniref:Antimicrobial protein n=1 Tax=Photorhabdus australis subsp. thailandensis TaxID=2805096 RepID=A0A1C0U2F3_9GAMM|nr:hypothetical protein [Photorhabdus australis]OCQ52036.1 hypothetical protein Ppb6_02830 [Photorhabdus australis subsp. thailandensis]